MKDLLKVVVTVVDVNLNLTCLLVFRVWVLWLWFQGSLSILGPLVLENSIRSVTHIFEEVIKGSNTRGSSEAMRVVTWCDSLLQTGVWVTSRRIFKFLLSLTLFLPGPWMLVGSLSILCLVLLASRPTVVEFKIYVQYFTGWNPKVIFPMYFVVVACNLALNPTVEIHIDHWMVHWVFCSMFVFSLLNHPPIYVLSHAMKRSLRLKSSAPPNALPPGVPYSTVKQEFVLMFLQLDRVPRATWVILLQRTVGMVSRLTPLHTPLLGIALLGPWILWFLGFSGLLCYLMFVCSTYVYAMSVCMFYILQRQIEICQKYYERSMRRAGGDPDRDPFFR